MDAQTAPDPYKALRWTIAATSFGFAPVQLDVTIVNVALPHIGANLHTQITGLQWVVDAYALVFAALLLTGGYAGDRFGAKRIYLGGLAIFATASLMCGLSGTAGELIAGRVLQGLGAAAMLPCSLALLNHAAEGDPRLRAWAIGWWTAASTVAIASGPLVGGLLLSVVSWRWIFLVNLPICLIGAALTARIPEAFRERSDAGFDPLGQILGALALGCIIGAVIELKPLGIASPIVIAASVVGVLSAIGFVVAESRVEHPMLPLGLFRRPGFAICLAYGAAVNFSYYGIVFVISLYLQRVLGYSPAQTGLAFIPLTATFFIGNMLCGSLVGRYGIRLLLVAGAMVDALGFALLLPLGAGTPYVAMVVPFALMPLGMGAGVPAMTTAVLTCVEKRQSGLAAAILNATRQSSGAVGVAVFGTLAGNRAGSIVSGLHVSAGLACATLLIAAALSWRGLERVTR